MTKTGPRAPHHPNDIASRRELARQLRRVRERLGMTQLDVAEDLGVVKSAVQKMESATGRDAVIATVQRHGRALDHAVRFRLLDLDAAELPSYPHLTPADADSRHRVDIRTQLVDVRHALGMSQAVVAQGMGVWYQAVHQVESGVSEPLLSTFQRYARALGGRLVARVVPAPAVDQVAIDLALEGKRRFGVLSEAEKVVLFRSSVPHTEWNRVALALRISGETARLWQSRAEAAA